MTILNDRPQESVSSTLAHPNIASVFDFDRTGGMAFMTMEMLSGKPLNEYLSTQLAIHGKPIRVAWPIIAGQGNCFCH